MNITSRIILLLLLASLALPAHAASLSVEAPLAAAGTPFLLPVTFSPYTSEINAVEGTIVVPDGIVIDSIDTTGSAFSLFATGPSYAPSSRSIEFTAGAPGGIPKNAVALLFIIHAHAESAGSYTLTPHEVSAYLNDGKGSRILVTSTPTQVSVGAPGSVQVDAFPPTAPAPLIAEIGKDDSLFDGHFFVTFYGGASGSAIDHYEVREGWWRSPVRADRYYVLHDQSQDSTMWVTAVSTNGKTVTTTLPAAHPWKEYALAAVLILIVGTVAFLVWRRFFRKN